MLKNDSKAEFLCQPEDRENVVVAVCVVVNDAFIVEHIEKRLHRKVARGHLLFVITGAPDLFAIVERFDELFAGQRSRLASRAWERRTTRPNRVGAVGHLHPASNIALGVSDQQVVDYVAVAELQVKGLAAQQVTRTRHYVGRRYSACLRSLETGVPSIYRVEYANVRLKRRGAVAARAPADVAVRIYQARHDDFARDVAPFGIRRNPGRAGWAYGDDLAAVNNKYAVTDGRSVDGDDLRSGVGLRAVLRLTGGCGAR
jgi:hypothetical protein